MFDVKFNTSPDLIVCFPIGRIDSTTAKKFENAIDLFRKQHQGAAIEFDCTGLEYISSAGLRVLLSLSKKEKINIKLTNVSQAVNDILNVTGFSTIFDVSRPMRDISDEKGHLMGETGGIALYRMDNDTILKLYPADKAIDDVKRELKNTKTALLSGVPALISYDIVTYNGRYGIVYEMPNVKTVSSLIVFQQWKLEQYASEMGRTLQSIHSCSVDTSDLPKTSELFSERALNMAKYMDKKEISKLISIINAIPDGNSFIYGNYHPGNVFAMNDELILINMAGVSCGNPVFDLGMSYMILVYEAELLVKRVSDIDVIQAKKFWDIMVRSYFDTDDEDVIAEKERVIKAMAAVCSALLPSMSFVAHDDAKRLVEKARSDVFGYPDYLKSILKEAKF
ncbi:MAG: anti-sigma factor antagonist [Synergistaceae bacterium]|nr:anti-sigma factor antagonist [Synergistaceae bacterium]